MNGHALARLAKARTGAWRIAQIAAPIHCVTTEEADLNPFVTAIEMC